MSKKRGRSKKRQAREKSRTNLSGAALTAQGLAAFKRSDYSQAIRAWEQARQKPDGSDKLPAALAEAYFRRALSGPASQNISDLRQATQLAPAEPRYHYHLALAQHRLGFLDEAEPIYRQLLAGSPPFERAAEPLAQLLVAQKKALNQDPVWAHLDEAAKNRLSVAEAIIKKKADSTLSRLAAQASLEPLWRGLALLAAEECGPARQSLQAAQAGSDKLSKVPRAAAYYYLGVLAARENHLEQALDHWKAAQAQGLNTRPLRENLATLLYQQALAEQQAGRPAQALELFEQFGDLRGTRIKQSELYRQLNLELGYAASKKGNWQQALRHWQEAEEAGDDSRQLLLNLALAYQRVEQHYEAAEYWRMLLRRRPRKADHPDALSDDQVARIWQNVAENYSMAGYYEEAITTYKNSIKWAPDNLNLRLKLVEAYQTEGRWQAAINELQRILDKNPDHVQALIMLAEIYSEDYWTYRQAHALWQRVLKLEPQHPVARQQLARLYEKQGSFSAQWGQLRDALKIYKEGLALVPDSQRLCTVIGGTYADLGDFKQARQYFEKALAINPNDLQTLYTIFMVWLDRDSKPDLQQIFQKIKAVPGVIPGSFFLSLADRCFEADHPEQAEALLKYAETRYLDSEDIMLEIALRYRELDQEGRAISILRQILTQHPDHAGANLRLGSIYYEMGQTRLAHRYFDKAEAQARKENNQMILFELKMTKDHLIHGKPLPQNPLEMLRNMPPDLKKQLLDQLPPEIAGILQNLDPDMIEAMMDLGMFDDDDDEEDYDYV
jgi:tetratricopeptide (TPR) repeat protein